MREKIKIRKIVGLCLDDACLKVALVQKRGRFFLVKKTAEDHLLPGEVVRGVVNKQKELAERLRLLWKKAGLSCRQVVLNIPEKKVFMKILEVPLMNEKELAEAIKWQIDENFPIDHDSLYYDWRILKKEGTKETMKVIVVACAKEVLDSRIKCLEYAGLLVVGFIPDSWALASYFMPIEKKGLLSKKTVVKNEEANFVKERAVATIEREIKNLNVTTKGLEVVGVGDLLLEDQKNAQALANLEASAVIYASSSRIFFAIQSGKEVVFSLDLSGEIKDNVEIASLFNWVGKEISRVWDYYKKNDEPDWGRIKLFYLVGFEGKWQGAEQFLKEMLAIDFIKIEESALVASLTGKSPEEASKQEAVMPEIALAVGLVAAFWRNAISLLSLEQAALIEEVRVKKWASTWIVWGLLLEVVVIYFLGTDFWVLQNRLQETENQLRSKDSSKVEELSKLETKIRGLESAIKKALRLEGERKKYIVWSQFLLDLVENASAGIVINEVKNNPAVAGEVTLSGEAATRDELLLYKARLEQVPLIKEIVFPVSNLTSREKVVFSFIIKLQDGTKVSQ